MIDYKIIFRIFTIMENNILINKENAKENFSKLEELKEKALKSNGSFDKDGLLKSIEDKKKAINNVVTK